MGKRNGDASAGTHAGLGLTKSVQPGKNLSHGENLDLGNGNVCRRTVFSHSHVCRVCNNLDNVKQSSWSD